MKNIACLSSAVWSAQPSSTSSSKSNSLSDKHSEHKWQWFWWFISLLAGVVGFATINWALSHHGEITCNTQAKDLIRVHVYTVQISLAEKESCIYLAFLEPHQGKVSVSLKFHEPPLATTELGKEKNYISLEKSNVVLYWLRLLFLHVTVYLAYGILWDLGIHFKRLIRLTIQKWCYG